MSFGGDYVKDTGDYLNAAKDAIAATLPEITIKDGEKMSLTLKNSKGSMKRSIET